MSTAFQLEQAERFQRLIAARTEPLTLMEALSAIDHIEALAGEPVEDHLSALIAKQRGSTVAPCYRCADVPVGL
jgi:hypothetical protein